VQDARRALTYGELDGEVDALAVALLGLGLRKGDRVASLFFNEWQAVVVYFATLRIGALIVPINHRLVAAEIAFQLRSADCGVLVYGDDFESTVAHLRGVVPVKHWIAAGVSDPRAGDHRLEQLLDEHRGRTPEPGWSVGAEDPSGVWFTSGVRVGEVESEVGERVAERGHLPAPRALRRLVGSRPVLARVPPRPVLLQDRGDRGGHPPPPC
jgi:acyl-CoA synthetase (AMP-forming)/AMP-acid ligase II